MTVPTATEELYAFQFPIIKLARHRKVEDWDQELEK
jgi:hypothetical protein